MNVDRILSWLDAKCCREKRSQRELQAVKCEQEPSTEKCCGGWRRRAGRTIAFDVREPGCGASRNPTKSFARNDRRSPRGHGSDDGDARRASRRGGQPFDHFPMDAQGEVSSEAHLGPMAALRHRSVGGRKYALLYGSQTSRCRLTASSRCDARSVPQPSKSAIVRATRRMRW